MSGYIVRNEVDGRLYQREDRFVEITSRIVILCAA